MDGHLDAVIVCVLNSGDTQYLGRLAGDGLGGFGPPDLHPELNLGPFWTAGPQSMALANMRGPGLPPVPVFGRSNHVPLHNPEYWNALCATYDWANADCLNAPEWPSIGPPIIAGEVAQARVFTLGGEKGILDFGADSTWHWSTRELAPDLPTTASNFKSLTIGDLGGDGPDIISASGSCGCGYKDVPAAGQVDVLYGSTAVGVPDQVGTKFASAPGVNSIATGDFNLDGREDLIGNSWSYDPAAAVSTGAVFVQEGNGAGALGAPQLFPLSHTEAFSRAPLRVADLDGNGGPDAVAIVGGQVQVLLNTQSRSGAESAQPVFRDQRNAESRPGRQKRQSDPRYRDQPADRQRRPHRRASDRQSGAKRVPLRSGKAGRGGRARSSATPRSGSRPVKSGCSRFISSQARSHS